MKNSIKKENFKVRNIYDNQGYTEQIIMEEFEIKNAVEKWLEENSFKELLRDHGIYRNSQSFGNSNSIVIDVRNGGIHHSYNQKNQMSADCPFFIDLITLGEQDQDDCDICEGNVMTVEVSEQFIIDNIDVISDADDIENYLETEKLENGNYKISWWGNEGYIEAENFVNNFMDQFENWETWKSDYEDYLLENLEDHESWEDQVEKYYNECRTEY